MRWPWLPVRVAGLSMVPTLSPGELVLVRRGVRPATGTVAVVRRPDRPDLLLAKRVVAGPGDVVGGRRLAADEWWVEGDNPAASDDSRVFGVVRPADFLGRVAWRYWPVGQAGRVR